MELDKMLSLEEKPKIFSDTNCFADIKNLTDMEEIKSAYLDIQKLEVYMCFVV